MPRTPFPLVSLVFKAFFFWFKAAGPCADDSRCEALACGL